MRQIKRYKGNQITTAIIDIFREYAKSRFEPEVYEEYFSYITSIQEYAEVHGVDIADEHIIIGEDWLFSYHIAGKEMILSDWISKADTTDKFAQSLEMYKTIKNVVLNSETEFFSASLRHSTSYPFYQMFKEKGIIDEFMDALSVNLCSDETYEQIANKVSRYDATLEELLETGKFTEQEKDYIYHDVTFELSPQYQKKKSGNHTN